LVEEAEVVVDLEEDEVDSTKEEVEAS